MEHIKDILNKYFLNFNTQDHQKIQEFLQGILQGKKWGKYIRWGRVWKSTIFLYAQSSVELYEFNLHREEVLKKIQERFPKIKNLKVKIKNL